MAAKYYNTYMPTKLKNSKLAKSINQLKGIL